MYHDTNEGERRLNSNFHYHTLCISTLKSKIILSDRLSLPCKNIKTFKKNVKALKKFALTF